MATNNQIQVTKEGLENLKSEHDELTNTKRPKLVDRLAHARSQGDLSENSDYQNARDELEFLDGRISELDIVLKHAVVVKSYGKKGQISFGTKVTLQWNGKKQEFHIVGEWEADPAEQKISHTSPLGQSLIGKKVGENVQVEAPAGKITYKILSID